MAGTTRFGYSGSGSGRDDDPPPPAKAERGQATVFGRDTHGLPLPLPRTKDPAAPPDAPAPAADAPPAKGRIPSHTGKSGFPARAGFWGRRNTDGRLEAASSPGDAQSEPPGQSGDVQGWQTDDDPDASLVRRQRGWRWLARHGVVLVLSALLSFLAVMVALRLGGRAGNDGRPRSPAPTAVPTAATRPPSPASFRSPASPAEASAPLTPEPGELSAPAPAPAPAPGRTTSRARRGRTDAVLEPAFGPEVDSGPQAPARKPRRAARPRASADQILPPTFLEP